jgi:hypothetical protein
MRSKQLSPEVDRSLVHVLETLARMPIGGRDRRGHLLQIRGKSGPSR